MSNKYTQPTSYPRRTTDYSPSNMDLRRNPPSLDRSRSDRVPKEESIQKESKFKSLLKGALNAVADATGAIVGTVANAATNAATDVAERQVQRATAHVNTQSERAIAHINKKTGSSTASVSAPNKPKLPKKLRKNKVQGGGFEHLVDLTSTLL